MPAPQDIAVIDYGSGNLASAARALLRAGELSGQAVRVAITDDAAKIRAADRIVLPGQGAFADCAAGLAARPGLSDALRDPRPGQPFLGICVGMQLMAERGLEHAISADAATRGFGWIEGEIAAIHAPGLRMPHMGWNNLDFTPNSHPLLAGLAPGAHAYFVHSYALRGFVPGDVLATTAYGESVPAIVAHGHRAGTQFHVEKSQLLGLRILSNFLSWTP